MLSAESLKVTLTRGILPQFFDLFTSMGGFLSMTTLVFAAVFAARQDLAEGWARRVGRFRG